MLGFAAAIALVATAAPAVAMPVSTFLSGFEKLDTNAPADQLAMQLAPLKAELQKDAAELRAERVAAVSAGKKPAYCPGPDGAHPSADEIIAALQEVPMVSRATTEVKDALRAYMAKRYPCGK